MRHLHIAVGWLESVTMNTWFLSSHAWTVLIPCSCLCLTCLASVIIYVYLRRYHRTWNKNETSTHVNILERYVNQLHQLNRSREQHNENFADDQARASKYLCQYHQTSSSNANMSSHDPTSRIVRAHSMDWHDNDSSTSSSDESTANDPWADASVK